MYNIFSDMNTELAAYWLGFFCADGHISKFGFYSRIKISTKDELHLLKLSIASDRKLNYIVSKKGKKSYPSCYIDFGKSISNLFRSFGLDNQKSNNLNKEILKFVPETVLHHFIRGYFDGDGCAYKGRGKSRYIVFTSNREWNECLLKLIQSKNNITTGYIKNITGCSQLVFTGTKTINKIKEWMYKESSIYLERKKEILDSTPINRGSSKYKFIYYNKGKKKWEAKYLDENKKARFIGRYNSEEEAYQAQQKYLGNV